MDLHNEMLLEAYDNLLPELEVLRDIVDKTIRNEIAKSHIFINSCSSRIKARQSLEGKLELKGYKYKEIFDITDLFGTRVVTYYASDVDRIASIAERVFKVDYANSIDKRKAHNIDQFGYMSLHYICYLPESLYSDPKHPNINKIPFELQMRTSLQDAWATIMHDTGYKNDIEVPKEQLRRLSRLSGILELADDEFSSIKFELEQYRKNVKQIVASGDFNDVDLNVDSFNEYVEIKPFKELNERIASINNMDIQEVSFMPYFRVFKLFKFNTLGDIEKLRKDNQEDAYQFAVRLFAETDIDIVASTIGLMCLVIVSLLKLGSGVAGLAFFLKEINGERPSNERIANKYFKIGKGMGLVKE